MFWGMKKLLSRIERINNAGNSSHSLLAFWAMNGLSLFFPPSPPCPPPPLQPFNSLVFWVYLQTKLGKAWCWGVGKGGKNPGLYSPSALFQILTTIPIVGKQEALQKCCLSLCLIWFTLTTFAQGNHNDHTKANPLKASATCELTLCELTWTGCKGCRGTKIWATRSFSLHKRRQQLMV